MLLSSTAERVTRHTADHWNQRIELQTERNIAYYAAQPGEIDKRLLELDHEWDIERTLQAQAAGISVASVILGIVHSRRWMYIPAFLSGFLMMHATQGWSPSLTLLRRMGVRTQIEIERERYALKALRGDFNRISALELGEEEGLGGKPASFSKRVLEIVKG